MSNIFHVTPFLLVPDFEAALDFFTRVLGFSVPFQMVNYAISSSIRWACVCRQSVK